MLSNAEMGYVHRSVYVYYKDVLVGFHPVVFILLLFPEGDSRGTVNSNNILLLYFNHSIVVIYTI